MINKTEDRLHGTGSLYSRFQEYLGEFVYGAIDGSVTTFAVVAGAAGADLEPSIVIILGFANLFADGFSMSVGSYLSTKTERDNYVKHEKIEYWEVEHMREKEIAEVRDIYREKGFEGELLEQVVAVITSDKDRWVKTMMKDELEMIPTNKSPLAIGGVTFLSFITVGFIPLFTYVWDYFTPTSVSYPFIISCVMTSIAFILIGFLKSYVTETGKFKGIAETLLLGGIAASVAYYVGDVLENLLK